MNANELCLGLECAISREVARFSVETAQAGVPLPMAHAILMAALNRIVPLIIAQASWALAGGDEETAVVGATATMKRLNEEMLLELPNAISFVVRHKDVLEAAGKDAMRAGAPADDILLRIGRAAGGKGVEAQIIEPGKPNPNSPWAP
jgi:hypothetical protein